jgi:adenine-specific DNA-methyltransferase
LQPTKANANRTLLAKHLNDYTAKNSFDYFIHKDLGGFLRQELDFYIKNEVMFLDDIEDAEVPAVESYLRSIKAIRKVAGKVVDFLAQIENFQKKLWLKKKFVVRCGYCVTLDRVPKEFYSQICANSEQLDEWISLGVVRSNEQVDKEYLEANDRLCIDTAHFAEETRRELIEKIMAQSSSPNGLVIHSENFHAIKAIENTYRGKINTVYIDPPYNTGNDGFIYKDGYSSSSWLSMQESRLRLVKQLLCEKGSSFWANIDDNEAHNFKLLLDAEFGSSCFVASNVWQKRYSRENREAIGDSHEYLFTYSLDVASFKEARGRIPLEEKQLSLYKNPDKDPKGKWQSVSLTAQGFRKNQMYGITAPNGQTHFPPPGSCWKIVEEKYLQEVENGSIYFGKDGNGVPRRKNYLKDSVGLVPWTWWPHSEVGHTDEAKKEFYSLLGTQTGFDTPKPVRLLQRVADIALSHDGIILDYFAGSGTTAHAIINRNRADGGNREYILVEQGTYFDTVLKPRIQKVIYSENWKDGKPVTKDENSDNPYNGVSHCFKYMKLESYEDTLNNLQLERSNERDDLLSQNPDVREDFLLNYMLDIEAEGALLNVEAFTHPFDYQMHIATDSAGEMHKQNVDLVETFNYLLGLQVHTQRKDFVHVPCTQDEQGNWQRDRNAKSGGKAVEGEADVFTFLTIDGTMPDGQSALVVWRVLNDFESADSKTRHNIALDYFLMERKRINPREGELDLIYVNGDNTLPNIRAEEEHWKVRLIEEEFHRLMFAEDD